MSRELALPLLPGSRRLPAWILLGCLAPLLLLPSTAHAATASPRELLDSGRADEALRLLTPQATGNNAAAFNYLGRVYFSLGDWDSAVRNCERATQLAPGNAEFQLWLGRSYGEKANVAAALYAYALARKTVAAFEAGHAMDRHNLDITRDLAEYYATAPPIVGGGGAKALSLAAEIAPEYPSTAAWIRAMVASKPSAPRSTDQARCGPSTYLTGAECGANGWKRPDRRKPSKVFRNRCRRPPHASREHRPEGSARAGGFSEKTARRPLPPPAGTRRWRESGVHAMPTTFVPMVVNWRGVPPAAGISITA